jgi:hypothetical protein
VFVEKKLDVLKNSGNKSDVNYNENLIVAKVRATVLVLRTDHPDNKVPIGVCQVKKNVRNASTERFALETNYRLLFEKKF